MNLESILKNKKILLIGGVGIAGVVILYEIMKGRSASGIVQATPGAPLTIPPYPVSSIQTAPIYAINAPQFQTYNIPVDRNLPPAGPGKSDCECGCASGGTPQFSASYINSSAENLRGWGSTKSAPSNLPLQFPPNLFPWLYSKGA